MNISFYIPCRLNNEQSGFESFIVETLFLFARQNSENRFILISDEKPAEQFSFYSNIETIVIKPISKNALLKKIWWDVKLPALLKKLKADLFISFDNVCSLTASIPQGIIVQEIEKTRAVFMKNAQLLIVTNKLMKKKIIENYKIPEEKIIIIYPSPNKIYGVLDTKEKEVIKNKYSNGKEFFLFNSIFSGKDDFVNLLKSFSHFKKRQQSSFKLLVSAPSSSIFEKRLAGYKYRNDIKFINAINKKNLTLITASAYAVILPFNINEDMIAALNAMRSGVPVITVKNSVINEVADDAASYAETETIKDIGEKMIQLYTDENYRSKLIEKGTQVSASYTYEKAADGLSQSIMKVFE